MIAIFLKELRENLKWALAVAAVLGLAYFQAASQRYSILLYQLAESTTPILAALAGLLFGLVQSLFETRPDNWALVVHRPLSRGAIFIAKCAAGLVLLYAALALPTLIVVIWAAEPGHLNMPFHFESALPLVADIFDAGCFYFAGMVLTLRQARWVGSRLLPLGAAVACGLLARFVAIEFWQAIAIGLAGLFLTSLGAWSVFATAGTGTRHGLAGAGLGTMLYCGASIVGVFLASLESMFEPQLPLYGYTVTTNGEVFRDEFVGGTRQIISDLAGRPAPEFDGLNVYAEENSDRFVGFRSRLLDGWDRRAFLANVGRYRMAAEVAFQLGTAGRPGYKPRDICVYDMKNRVIDLFDVNFGMPAGTVGPAGFSASPTPANLFPRDILQEPWGTGYSPYWGPSYDNPFLVFTTTVYWMELDQRRVRVLFSTSAEDPVMGATAIYPPELLRSHPTDATVLVATKRRILHLRPSGQVIFTIPSPLKVVNVPVLIGITKATHHIFLEAIHLGNEFTSPPGELVELAPDGKLVRRTSLPPLPRSDEMPQLQAALFGFVIPPAGLPFYQAWNPWEFTPHWRLFLIASCLGSVLSAAATLILARLCALGKGKTIAWCVGNLLLGPCGVAVFLSLHGWPVRETCAACGKRRAIEPLVCPRCGATAPPPTLNGREIFETPEAMQPVS